MHIRNFLAWLRLFIILFHLYLWDSFPAMLAFWPFYQIQLWTCLSDHSSRSRRTTIFLKKAGSLERTAFVHSSMQRRNKTLWVLWNCSDTWKLFYNFFFYRKDKANLCFLQQDFLIYKKKKAWTWAKWTVVSAFMFFSLWTGAILISKL